jgi:hypothetical protein
LCLLYTRSAFRHRLGALCLLGVKGLLQKFATGEYIAQLLQVSFDPSQTRGAPLCSVGLDARKTRL